MARTRIKICGITTEEAALAAVEAGADAVGFVFAKESKRRISPEDAWDIAAFLPPFVTSVGLFVNPTVQQFQQAQTECPFDLAQLHGDESEKLVQELGPDVIKAIRFDPNTIERELKRWSDVGEVDALLIDGSAGGQGTAFDWSALARVQEASDHPIIVAGGLTPQNVGDAIRALRPYAVDVSSGVEDAKGRKDPRLIEAFCKAVREADAG